MREFLYDKTQLNKSNFFKKNTIIKTFIAHLSF